MRVLFQGLFFCLLVIGITACSSDTTLKAPCPNYGAGCVKQPINSWNNYN